MTPPAIVFTDLDGTLLGHDDYRFDAALPALRDLASRHIPVVPVTSKTTAELRVWMQRLELHDGCIVENGSAVILPGGRPGAGNPLLLGLPRADILAQLCELRGAGHDSYEAFSDMTVERLVELTGLTLDEAADAARREYSEALYWTGDEAALREFSEAVTARGLKCLRGGRFVHVLGDTDKGRAALALKDHLCPSGASLIALGDSPNDADLIRAADIGVWVRSPNGNAPDAKGRIHTLRTCQLAPAGWAEGIESALNLLDELDRKQGLNRE